MKQLFLHNIPKVKLKFCDVCSREVKTMNLSPNYKGSTATYITLQSCPQGLKPQNWAASKLQWMYAAWLSRFLLLKHYAELNPKQKLNANYLKII